MKQKNANIQVHVHIDADAFFASVEQVLHRKLRGKAIVVGQNGGIVSALSYPAKALGVSRVSPITQVRKQYPSVQIVASDFYAYGIFSQRMENIIRKHFPNLVKNSIDEGSIDMSTFVKSFDEAKILVEKLQDELYQKLGCTFSFGIAPTPLLAKLASGMKKPKGITVLQPEKLKELIYHLPANHLSGIGKQSYTKLCSYNIKTIGDFANADTSWLGYNFSSSLPSLQKQVLGELVHILTQKESIQSMSRDRSFPATNNFEYLYSQLSMNIEHLSQRMRKEDLFTKRIGIRLRDQNLNFTDLFITLTNPTREPQDILSKAQQLLKSIYRENTFYRQVSVTCVVLSSEIIQNDLFGELQISESKDAVLQLVDQLEHKFGKKCIGLASSLEARSNFKKIHSIYIKGDIYPHPLLTGEEIKKRLMYPFLGTIN